MNDVDIGKMLSDHGPQTGWQLMEATGLPPLVLWRQCRRAPEILLECVGRRYLRLDRNVEGYARMSPSIRREFLTYTVLGLGSQRAAIEDKARKLREEILQISRAKMDVARAAIRETVGSLTDASYIEERVCFLIAGDITYGMGHAVPRPEISTGRMVRGSDLDIVAVAEDEAPEDILKELDAAILKKKYYLLVHPNYQEEIDYLIKTVAKVREQLAFDSFPHMVAGKILHESELLWGSTSIYDEVKRMVGEFGIPGKINDMTRRAEGHRKEAESRLLDPDVAHVDESYMSLFYTREEGDEIY